MPAQVLLPDAEPTQRSAILNRLGGNAKGASIDANIPLIRQGSDLILIDNGSGTNFQASAGKLAENLAAAGVRPEQITKVIFTHVHPDHSGATTTANGVLRYPNADYYVSEDEKSAFAFGASGQEQDQNARLSLEYPGIGYAERAGTAYRFVSVHKHPDGRAQCGQRLALS